MEAGRFSAEEIARKNGVGNRVWMRRSVATVAVAGTVLDYSIIPCAGRPTIWNDVAVARAVSALYKHFWKRGCQLPIHSLGGFDCESQPNSFGDGK